MSKLVKIKKEHQLGCVDKTQAAVPEEEGASKNLQMKKKGKKRKGVELEEIMKEDQLSGAEKIQVPLDAKEPWRWHVIYSSVLSTKTKTKRLGEGFIPLRGNVKCIVLHDTDGRKIDAKYHKEGETVYSGAAFEFPCHLVDVGEPILEDDAIFAPIEQGKKMDLKRKRLKRNPQHVASPEAA